MSHCQGGVATRGIDVAIRFTSRTHVSATEADTGGQRAGTARGETFDNNHLILNNKFKH